MTSKKSKPFFYRLNAADLFAVVRNLSDDECAVWLRGFASDLVAGESNDEFTNEMIQETEKYRERQSIAGKKGMASRYKR